jgi:dihydrofolate reductase
VSSERTRIEREFDAAAIRRLKESSRSDITIGGAELAGQAIAEGLVDECHLSSGRS